MCLRQLAPGTLLFSERLSCAPELLLRSDESLLRVQQEFVGTFREERNSWPGGLLVFCWQDQDLNCRGRICRVINALSRFFEVLGSGSMNIRECLRVEIH